jgi:hypothetical protein
MSVAIIINKKSSKSPRVMTLVRKLVLACLDYNILLKAEDILADLFLYSYESSFFKSL